MINHKNIPKIGQVLASLAMPGAQEALKLKTEEDRALISLLTVTPYGDLETVLLEVDR